MKPGTFTQLYVHIVFAVKNRDAVLKKTIRDRVFKYLNAMISKMNHKAIIVNGVSDHVHILLGLNPSLSLSKTVQELKRNSSKWINQNNMCVGRFEWQEGYGAFTYSRSQIENVYNYILNQERHHEKRTFKEEYISFLEKYEIEYESHFLFSFYD